MATERRYGFEDHLLCKGPQDRTPSAAQTLAEIQANQRAFERLNRCCCRTLEIHPEDTCEECGGPNVVWFAPNDLWNQVMRGGDRGAPDVVGIVCPVCFIRRAEAAGVKATGWLVQPEVIHAD